MYPKVREIDFYISVTEKKKRIEISSIRFEICQHAITYHVAACHLYVRTTYLDL